MTTEEILSIFNEFFIITVQLAGPILLISMVVGVIIAIFQAVSQIHEQTITFVPKLLVIGLILLVLGSSMLATIQDFTRHVFSLI